MQKKLKEEGLVCYSVCLDDPDEPKSAEQANRFLKEQKAEFDHFLLKEKVDDWTKKLGIVGPPAIFVFGRDGKLAKTFKAEQSDDNPDGSVTYAKIEPFVREQLKRKE